MLSSESALSRVVRFGLPLLTAFLALGAAYQPSAAAENNTFVIDGLEGYGITECLSGGRACGKIVADAWCEAHGAGPAIAFGRAEDMTASVPANAAGAQSAKPSEPAVKTAEIAKPDSKTDSMIVRCAD